MTYKLELKSCHEVIYTVSVADVDSIFYGRPIGPDILTVVMKNGKRLYCDEVCPIDSLPEEPVSEDLDEAAKADAMIERPDDTEVGYDLNRYGGFISGAQWREEQMMAKAVDGVVHHFEKCGVASVHYTDPTGVPMAYFTSPEGLSAGDKVKIIVIKED